LVVFPASCISSVSPGFYFRKHAFCFLPHVAILESPGVLFFEMFCHDFFVACSSISNIYIIREV
jgi:hypothetical protein